MYKPDDRVDSASCSSSADSLEIYQYVYIILSLGIYFICQI